jgi:hypothetical protein
LSNPKARLSEWDAAAAEVAAAEVAAVADMAAGADMAVEVAGMPLAVAGMAVMGADMVM